MLAALLLFGSLTLPVRAETEPVQQETQDAFVPTIPWTTGGMPMDVSGDASIQNGSHTINGMVPVAGTMEYTA